MRNSYKYTKMYSGGEPLFTEGDVFTIKIPLSKAATATVGPSGRVTTQDTPQVTINDNETRRNELVDFCVEPRSKQEMMRYLGLADSKYFREAYLVPLLKDGLIEMTIPDKPTSRNQRYKKSNNSTV